MEEAYRAQMRAEEERKASILTGAPVQAEFNQKEDEGAVWRTRSWWIGGHSCVVCFR